MTTFTLTEGDDVFPQPGDDNAGDDAINGLGGNDLISAGTGSDVVTAGTGSDTVFGEAGDDILSGGEGGDSLDGGGDDDDLNGEAGADTLLGGDGDDTLDGGLDDDRLNGGAGADFLFGGDGADRLIGGAGADTLDGGADNDLLKGGGGSDRLTLIGGFDRAAGGGGNDSFALTNGSAGQVNGNAGFDTIEVGITTNLFPYAIANVERLLVTTGIPSLPNAYATSAQYQAFTEIRDIWALTDVSWFGVLDGGFVDFGARTTADMRLTIELDSTDGNEIVAGANDDTVVGHDGDDILDGGTGNDSLSGGGGNDTLDGGLGGDTLSPGTGENLIVIDDALDVYIFGGGTDTAETSLAVFTIPAQLRNLVYTGTANAMLTGSDGLSGSGDNRIEGGSGDDTIVGGTVSVFNGDDTLEGRSGNDSLEGGNGLDQLFGGNGRDVLDGGDQSDTLDGGRGRDTLSGGAMADSFRFLAADMVDSADIDVVDDFSGAGGEGDVLDLSDFAGTFIGTAAFTGVAGEVREVIGAGETRVLADIDGDQVADFEVRLTLVAGITELDLFLA